MVHQCLELLLAHGARHGVENGDGDLPLHVAIKQSLLTCMQTLLTLTDVEQVEHVGGSSEEGGNNHAPYFRPYIL